MKRRLAIFTASVIAGFGVATAVSQAHSSSSTPDVHCRPGEAVVVVRDAEGNQFTYGGTQAQADMLHGTQICDAEVIQR